MAEVSTASEARAALRANKEGAKVLTGKYGQNMPYLYEYIFKRLVDHTNELHDSVGAPRITTSMARELRGMVQHEVIRMKMSNMKDAAFSLQNPDGSMKSPEEQAKANAALAAYKPFSDPSISPWHVALCFGRMLVNKGVKGSGELDSAFFVRHDTEQGVKVFISPELDGLLKQYVSEFEQMYAQGVVPASPFDPDLMYRDAFMDAGMDCRYVRVSDLDAHSGTALSYQLGLPENPTYLYETAAIARSVDASKPGARALGTQVTDGDRSGFSRLRQYLSTEDYDNVVSAMSSTGWNMRQLVYVRGGQRVDAVGARDNPMADRAACQSATKAASDARLADIRRGKSREDIRGGPVALERATAILEMLRSEGIPFTVRPNSYEGQVILEFENKMELRLIDVKNPERSGIRMYHDGRQISLDVESRAYERHQAYALSKGCSLEEAYKTSDRVITNNLSNVRWVPHLDATPAESVAFVKFCLGRAVNTFGPDGPTSRPAGQISPMVMTDKKHALCRSVHTENRFYADLGTFVNADGNSFSMCVDYNSEDRSSTETTYQADGPSAREWLTTSINSARQNFYDAVDIDYLISKFHELRSQGDMSCPAFSMDPDVAFVQRQYWDILTGAQQTLVKPGHDMEGDDGDSLSDAVYEVSGDDATGHYVTFDGQVFGLDGDPNDPTFIPEGRVEMIRRHLVDTLDYNFGSFEKTGPEAKRFNPAYVARFMSSSHSLYRNIDDIVVAAKTYIRATMESRNPDGGPNLPPAISDSFSADDLRGDDFTTNSVRERLVVFDETKAVPMAKSKDPFLQRMYGVIKSSLEANGCMVKPEDIEIDENFVVRYNVEELFFGKLHAGKKSKTPGKRYEGRNEVPDVLLGNVSKSFYGDDSFRDWIHTRTVTGFIGRIIPPGPDGMVRDGKYFHAPGYTATIRPNRFGEDASFEARMVLTGYEQSMADAIRNRIRADTLDGHPQTGDSTAVDNVLRHLYDVRYPDNFYERTAEDGLSPELRDAIVKTNTQRIKIHSDLMKQANRVAIYQTVASGHDGGSFGGQEVDFNPLVDNDMNPVTLTGGRNIAINDSPGDGYVDHMVTGNGGAQGVRYLVEGATVSLEGSITPAEIPYTTDEAGNIVKDLSQMPRCALADYLKKTGRMVDYDAVDRGNMTVNGLLHCMRETDRVGVAQLSFGGWTLEDGLVISKRFADMYKVPDADHPGQYRSLAAGDKIECHGNKGVVSIVIDPDMPDDKAREDGVLEQVRWMRANPNMDVVMAPYSHVSRFNAGLGAEAMGLGEKAGVAPEHVMKPEDLVAPDGRVMTGCLGHAKFTILEQTADVKTHFDEDGTPKRSYGAQAGWAMAAANCPNMLIDSFSDNSKSLMELRELLITCGMDISADGRLLRGYHAQPGEERNVIETLPLTIQLVPRSNGVETRTVYRVNTADAFMDEISRCGGFVEIPFQLEFPRFAVDDEFDFAEAQYTKEGFAKSRCDARGNKATLGFLEPMPQTKENGEKTFGTCVFGKTFKLPVMSSTMRSGQDFEDGKAIYHDWSNAYRNIYSYAVEYQGMLYNMIHETDKTFCAQNPGDVNFEAWLEGLRRNEEQHGGIIQSTSHKDGTPWTYLAAVKARDDKLAECQKKAQGEFDRITQDIVQRKLESKHNIFRTGIMANKQANSATAIWTGDPRRKVDEVGMNPDMMKALGVKEGEYVMLHRDPVLRDGGMRYMKVVSDPRLVGIAVNPAGIPKSMDGDFDGDTIGVHVLGSDAAKSEAMQNLSVYANLLDSQSFDKNSWNEATHRYERHKLFIAGGQDVAAGIAASPDLQRRYDMIEEAVNKFENAYRDGNLSADKLAERRMWAKNEIDSFLTDCYSAGIGRNVISYESPEAHLQSCLQYVNDGAKGNAGKVSTYAASMGLSVDFDENKQNVVAVHENEHGVYSDDVRKSNIGILQAKNMQTEYTGFGGMFSIRAIRALYNVDPKAALELTYVATQAVLQVKHDAVMADRYEQILSGPARWVWQGYKLEPVVNQAELKAMQPSGVYHKDARTGEVSERMDYVTSKVPLTWRIAKDPSGKPIVATRAEFVKQFKEVYGQGMGLSVNDEFVHRVADLLSRDYNPAEPVPSKDDPVALKNYRAKLDASRMMNVEKEAVAKYGAPLQRLAYGAKLRDVAEIATENRNIFAAPTLRTFHKNFNLCMADAGIMRKNLKAVMAHKAPTEIIAQQDVLVGGEQRMARTLMGSKMVQSTHQKGFKAEAPRAENKALNPDRGISASTKPAEPVVSKPAGQPVQTPAAQPNVSPDAVMNGTVAVPGPFNTPGGQTVQEVQKPVVPGAVFPDSSKASLGSMNLAADVSQASGEAAEIDDDVPAEFLAQEPIAYPHEREVREAEEIERQGGGGSEDGMGFK